MKKNIKAIEIAKRSAELAVTVDETGTTHQEFFDEFIDQIKEGSYNTYLRAWLGYMVEQKCKEAVEVMKMIIRYRMEVLYD